MRVLRLMILVIGMLGGAIGLSTSVDAAPMPMSGVVAETRQGPLVDKAYFYFIRRRYYRPRYYYRPRFYRRYYRPRYFYRPRFYRRHYYRPRFYRRHYYRPRYYRRRFFF